VEAQKAMRLEEAEKLLRQVLQNGGDAPATHQNLGIIHQLRGEHEAALKEFREAIRQNAGSASSRTLAGWCLTRLGRMPEAIRELDAAVRLAPGDPAPRRQLAAALERSGQLARAAAEYRTLRKLAPKEPECAYRLGRVYLALSAEYARRLKQSAPRSARLRQVAAENLLAQGEVDRAIRAYQDALTAAPGQPELHLALAQVYARQGKREAALAELDRELAIVPESAAALELRKMLLAGR
jgi:tetratricopeptide (TPR) repeat protein